MRYSLCGAAALAFSCLSVAASGADNVAGNLVLFNDNGGWSWFEEERAIVDPATGQILVGSIADASGTDGAVRNGSVEVATFNLATRQVSRFKLGTLPADDHNTPGLLVRPDGRYLAMYAAHNSDRFTRWRVSTNPGDATSWQAEKTVDNGIGATYNNVFRLASENKVYDFTRTVGFDPNYLVSTDDGSTWAYGGRLLRDPADQDNGRPYLKYASDNDKRIHFITTEAHPRDFSNGVYHGYIEAGKMYKSDGTVVGDLGSNPPADAFTPLLSRNQVIDGSARTNGWTTDVTLDKRGNPYAVFTSRVNSNSADHRLYYGRWTGSEWDVHEMAKMGAGLYAGEADYTGLASIDPRDPKTVYVSTNVDPTTGNALAKHEIYKATTADGGATWNWAAVTQNSTVENLRPIVPAWDKGTAVLWLRGNAYTSYTDFDLSVVGLVKQDGEATGKAHFIDASPSNTTLANGNPVPFTSSSDQGPADNQWHARGTFGNGGTLFTAGENADEDAPRLKTTTDPLPAGVYDVFVYFWANPSGDWQIQAGLNESELCVFRQDGAQQPTASDFDGSVTLTGSGNTFMYQAYLGRVPLDAAGAVSVFIDDSPLPGGGSNRTWYDGIGVARVTIPEPTYVGAGMGAVALSNLRNRRR